MKKQLKIIMLCLLLCLLSACSPNSKKVAFFLYSGEDTFISEMTVDIKGRVRRDMEYEILVAGNSQSVQNQQITELIDDGYDLFAVNAVDRLACSAILEKCEMYGLPVVFFNREPQADTLMDSDVYYVGADADSFGKKQAVMVAELFKVGFEGSKFDRNGDGIVQTVIIKGEQGHQDAEKRTANCVAQLKELGFRVEVLALSAADWNRRDAYEVMRRFYTQYGDRIELVFSNNDDMALGATDYLLDMGVFKESSGEYDQPFVVVGVDGTTVGLNGIERGVLYGTIYNDSWKQADAVLRIAESILDGVKIQDFPYEIKNEHYIYVDGDIVTRTNLTDYTS